MGGTNKSCGHSMDLDRVERVDNSVTAKNTVNHHPTSNFLSKHNIASEDIFILTQFAALIIKLYT
jgi:hypothetical protein